MRLIVADALKGKAVRFCFQPKWNHADISLSLFKPLLLRRLSKLPPSKPSLCGMGGG